MQLFFSWKTDTYFITCLHSWVAETANKQKLLSLLDRVLKWKPLRGELLWKLFIWHSSVSPHLYFVSLGSANLTTISKAAGSGQFIRFREAQVQTYQNKMDFVSSRCTELWPGLVERSFYALVCPLRSCLRDCGTALVAMVKPHHGLSWEGSGIKQVIFVPKWS